MKDISLDTLKNHVICKGSMKENFLFFLKLFGEVFCSFGIRVLKNTTEVKRGVSVVIFLKSGFPVGSNLKQISAL